MIPRAQQFLELYAKSLDKRQALQDSGLGARMLRKLTEPRFVEYDSDFTEGYLEVEEELMQSMLQVAVGVAHSSSRQKLSAAKFSYATAKSEIERVEVSHVRWLEDAGRERLLAERNVEKLDEPRSGTGPMSIEEMKSGGGAFAKAGTGD